MGKVYLAHHPGIGRRSAIKVLHPNLAGDPAAVSRFFTEARASNAIRHPNIVEIFDSGTLDTGAPYIIMEHLEGETLAARMVRGLALGQALDFACQAASALAAAHSQQVVHRDLKPENLFVTKDPRDVSDLKSGGHELVKVLDFGVAKLQQRLEEPAHRTRSGALVGTPRYMSPEQCLGEATVDERSDIYSLGVIVYELVCGRPPFVTEAVGAVINMHINRPPDPPRQVNPAISAPLESAILRALAKNPADRFASMGEFLQELRATAATLGDASQSIPPRGAEVAASTKTPTPLSAMATLMDDRPITGRSSTPPPAAVSRPDTTSAQPTGRTPWRRWVFVIIGLVEVTAALVLFLLLRPDRNPPPPARATSGTAAHPADPSLPATTTGAAGLSGPATAGPDVLLDSVPPGATVTVAGRTLGVTPLRWRPPEPADVMAFSFELEGHRREIIHALPAPGLRLKPQLRRAPGRRPGGGTGKGAAADPSLRPDAHAIPDDIKSER